VLLLGCGDLRSIWYTSWRNHLLRHSITTNNSTVNSGSGTSGNESKEKKSKKKTNDTTTSTSINDHDRMIVTTVDSNGYVQVLCISQTM
jgi:hypothetical protein